MKMLIEKRPIPGYENYEITPNGLIYNIKRKAWIKPNKARLGYYTYTLNGRHKLVHRLVALTYLGPCPNDGLKYEIDHIDENKGNNHYSNLQWITHADNVRKSFKLGNRGCWWKGKTRPSPSLETKIKMANAKYKKVSLYKNGKLFRQINSVQKAAGFLGIGRTMLFLAQKTYCDHGIPYKGYMIKF